MTRRVIFTRKAEAHLDSIHSYIRRQSGCERADAFVGSIIAFCRSLDAFPHRGTRRDDILPGLRIIPFRRRITLAITADETTVVVGGVYYGGQDYQADIPSHAE